jgi:DNA/RNA-binding domain of Phe-tRNA-synthetase-like protein
VSLTIEPHPLLTAGAFSTGLPKPLGDLSSPDWLTGLFKPEASAPLTRDEGVRAACRDLLRLGGYKPTGRGKPSSEYLVGAAAEGRLSSINAAVDACNAVSLHSGLPISVVDLDLAKPPFRIGLAPAGAKYVFNASGQEIDLEGLLCLFDSEGPCANAVKDCQRTKTHPGTMKTLSVVWGSKTLGDRTARTTAWYRELLGRLGAETTAL